MKGKKPERRVRWSTTESNTNLKRKESWDAEADREHRRRERFIIAENKKKDAQLKKALDKETAKWTREADKEYLRREKILECLQARATKGRERAEAAKWNKELRPEATRRAHEYEKRRDLQEAPRWHGKRKYGKIREQFRRRFERIPQQPQPVLISDAIRGNTQKWVFKGNDYKHPVVFLENTGPAVVRLINSINSAGKKVNGVLTKKLVKSDPVTGEDTYTVIHRRSKVHTVYDNANEDYDDMRERMLENFYKWQRNGGDWRLHSVGRLDIYITKFDPVIGKRYTTFPKCIVNKKAVINMENNDDQCFKWSVTRALHPAEAVSEL